MLPQFVILPLAALLVWLALARGIKPLHRLEERIRARKPEDLFDILSQAAPPRNPQPASQPGSEGAPSAE